MQPTFEVIRFQAEAHPIDFLRTRSFSKEFSRIFTSQEQEGLLNYIAANPESGAKIPGANGIRKIRWKAKGQGKRGGARVIYYFRDLNMPMVLLAVYAKGEKSDLSAAEMKEIQRKVDQVVDSFLSFHMATGSSDRRA